MLSDDLLQTLQQFVDTSLLHWIEICSLLGELRGAIIALDVSHRALIVSDFVSKDPLSHAIRASERRQKYV